MKKTIHKALLLLLLSFAFSVSYYALSLDQAFIGVFGDFAALIIYLVVTGVTATGAAILFSFELMDRSVNAPGAKTKFTMVMGTSLVVVISFFALLALGDTIDSGSALGALWIPLLIFTTILLGLCTVMILGLVSAYTNNALDRFFAGGKNRKRAQWKMPDQYGITPEREQDPAGDRKPRERNPGEKENEEIGGARLEDGGGSAGGNNDGSDAESTFFEGKVGEFLQTDRFRFAVKGYGTAENLKEIEKGQFRQIEGVTVSAYGSFLCLVRMEVENTSKKELLLDADDFMLNWGHENPDEAFGQGLSFYKTDSENEGKRVSIDSKLKAWPGKSVESFVIFQVPTDCHEEYSFVYFDSDPSSGILSKMYVVHLDEKSIEI